jgi:hypothetical protein
MVDNDGIGSEEVKVVVSFGDFPLKHFKRFKKEAIARTGTPGLYWKTVIDLMDELEYLRKIVALYEQTYLIPFKEEEEDSSSDVVNSSSRERFVSLGGHEE